VLKWGDSYDGHGEMYYDYNHGPSYKHHEPSYHGKADDNPVVYKPEPIAYKPEPYKPEPTYNWLTTNVWRFAQISGRMSQIHFKWFDSTRTLSVLT